MKKDFKKKILFIYHVNIYLISIYSYIYYAVLHTMYFIFISMPDLIHIQYLVLVHLYV